MRVSRFLAAVALLLVFASSSQTFAAVNFDGFTTLAGNGRHVAIFCKDGNIAKVMEYTTVGAILPIQAIGKQCDGDTLRDVFPDMVVTSIDDPRLGWVDAIDHVSICIGSTLTTFDTTDSGEMTFDITLNAEECPLN